MKNLPYKPPQPFYDLTRKSDICLERELETVQGIVDDLATQVARISEQLVINAYRGK